MIENISVDEQPVEFRSQNAISFAYANYNQMKKKDSTAANGQGHLAHSILFKLASQNFQRKNIDSAMITTINGFIFSLGEAITSNTGLILPDTLKLAIDIIIAFELNLSDQSTRHTCTVDQIVTFFSYSHLLFEKVASAWNDIDKLVHSDLINILWFLLDRKVEEVRLPPLDKRIDVLNSLIRNSQAHNIQRNSETLIKESFSFVCLQPNSKNQISNLFISYLRNPNAYIINFKNLIQKYLFQCLVANHLINFKKALPIYHQFGATFEERRANMEDLTIKILQSNHNFNFVVEINQLYSFSKLFTGQTSLKAIVKTIQKIIEKPSTNPNITKILEEMSQLNLSDIEDSLFDRLDLKLQIFLVRIIDWVISRSYKKDDESEIKEKALQEAEQKQEKLIEFVKKLSSKVGIEEVQQQNSGELQKICNAFSKILKKMIVNKRFRSKLTHVTLDSFPFLKNDKIVSQSVKNFILEVVPCLLLQFNLSFKEKSPLVYAVVLRRAEIEAQKQPEPNAPTVYDFFIQAYFQLLHPDSLNFHFVVCFILMKYLNEKETIVNLILDQLLKDLSKEGKNRSNRNLIINMALLLKMLHPVSSSLPVKFKVRQFIKNSQALAQKMDINQIMVVCSKQLGILRCNNYPLTQKCLDFQLKLNEQLQNYTKDFVTIFYSLIIGISDTIEQSDGRSQDKNNLLVQIKFIRKISFLSEVYTLIRCFIQKSTQWSDAGVNQDKKISVFLLLSKICFELKNKASLESLEDLDLFISKLLEYMLQINTQLTPKLLTAIDHFKNNKHLYRQQKFLQYLTSKNFIRFYSESVQDIDVTHIILMRTALKLYKKAFQAKKQSFEHVQQRIKTLFLIYLFEQSPSEFNFTQKHENHLKHYILLLLLANKIEEKADIIPIIEKLKSNSGIIKQLTLPQHEINYLNNFKEKMPLNFIAICVKAIVDIFNSYDKQHVELFRFVLFLVDDDRKNNCDCLTQILRGQLQQQLQNNIIFLILKRVQIGLELTDQGKIQFLNDSSELYQLLSTLLHKIQLLTLVEDIVQIDYYSECDKSAFLLKQIANIFSVIEEKGSPVCETVFNYIITLAQIFPGQEKLEIANFICNFFGLETSNQDGSMQGLQKPVSLQCSNQCNYKCLKCDDKRLLCLGCSLVCHKDHPVCYLSIPPEVKISRCQCREIPSCCQFSKESSLDSRFQSSKIKSEFPHHLVNPLKTAYVPAHINGPNNELMQKIKYGIARPRQQDNPFSGQRFEYNQYIQDEQYDRMEHQLMGGDRYYESIVKDEFIPRMGMGSRIDRLFERDEFAPQPYRIQIDHGRPSNPVNPFIREKQQEKESPKEEQEISQPEFIDQDYDKEQLKMEIQEVNEIIQNQTILKKYSLLPKFIDLMINFCSKKAIKDKNVANLQLWSPVFNNPVVQRIMNLTLKLSNPGSFHTEVRKQNPLNNVSCVLIKRNLAYNNKFLIIATGTDLQVYSKQKLLIIASEAKVQGFNPIHRHSVSYEIHSVEISPIDKSLFCATGLHNLSLFTINNDGGIGRTQNRYNVNNLYINKIKLTKMGIFVGVQKEIRVLNYTCKQFLTIKAQESNTLIRQWAIYQKAAGCQVYFVCPNGNIFFTDVLPADQGRKDFSGRVNDSRKSKNTTGASVFVKDLPDIGKQLFASFKDGYNILGRLEGDQMQNMTDIRLKGIQTDKKFFDNFFIVGHVDIVKLPQIDDVFVICTAKKYFPPEMAFHQGFLTVVRMKKDGNSEIQILNDEATCETFQVFYVGTKSFFIVSLHTDGSLHLNSPTKMPKAVIDEQLRKARQSQQGSTGMISEAQPDVIDKIRKTLQKQLKFQKVRSASINSSYLFRQNTDGLRHGTDYIISKLNENQYQLKQLTFGKIITGISLPYFGSVELPTRNINNVFQVGFTYSESLYFFANGSFRFKYFKNQAQKYTRQSINLANNRILQKIERIERLNNEYSQHQRFINSSMMSNFLNIKEDVNQDLIFVGRSFQNFKLKIGKFDQLFSIESDDESSSIEKTALIIKMFLTKGLKEGNFCQKEEILELVNSLKQIVADVNRKLFILLKEIIVIAMKVYEKQIGSNLNLFNEENYGLRAATQSRLVHFYNLLKLDIGDEELNELLELLIDIIHEDLSLFAYYCAKYSGMLAQIYRRIKRPDTDARAQMLVKIYAIGYPVLHYCQISCGWVLPAILHAVYGFVTYKGVRESLFDGLRMSKYLLLEPALKGLGNHENDGEDIEILKNVQQGLLEEQGPKDPVAEIYMMFNRGEIDEDTMIKMIQDATKLQYEKAQEINQKPPQQEGNIEAELQLEMEPQIEELDNNKILLFDLIYECTENFEGDLDHVLSKIVTLYVVSKVIDTHYREMTDHLLQKIYKMVSEIDLKCEGERLTAVLTYSCLFNRIFVSSSTIKANGYKAYPPYEKIQAQANNKLANLEFQKIPKLKGPVNLLPRIFRGEKPAPQAHIAYAFANLFLYPCEPTHILLSLECYWLLPDPKESYSRQKCESSIRDGINSGNLAKVYEIAKEYPEIWQHSDEYLDLIERWIEQKRNDWELALQLLAIYYQN